MNKGYIWEVILINDKKGRTLKVEFDTLEECEEYEEKIHRLFKDKYRTDIQQVEI